MVYGVNIGVMLSEFIYSHVTILSELQVLGGGKMGSNSKIRGLLVLFVVSLVFLASQVFFVGASFEPENEVLNTLNVWTVQTGIDGDTKIWDNGILGQGQTIGMGDCGLGYDHEAFRNSTILATNAPGPGHRKVIGYHAIQDHGDLLESTYVHGSPNVCMAAGNSNYPGIGSTYDARGVGIAPNSTVSFCDMGIVDVLSLPTDMSEMYQPAYDDGARIFTQGIITGDTGIYNERCSSTDLFMWNNPDMVIMTASGSSGEAVQIAVPGTAKNILSVGASENDAGAENVAWFTSRGPADDSVAPWGRIKPDIIAPGDGDGGTGIATAGTDFDLTTFGAEYITEMGSGEASAVASGATALVRQYFTEGYYPSGTPTPADALVPSSALMRGMLINTAQEMTGTDAHNNPYNGMNYPNCDQGWGRIVLDNALYFPGDAAELAIHDDDVGVMNGVTKEYYLTIDDNSVPLEITVAWNDYPSVAGSPWLRNNLDLTVTDIDGGNIVYYGNVFGGVAGSGQSVTGGSADIVNTIENFLRLTPTIGTYKIEVTATSLIDTGIMPYALVVTGGIGSFVNDDAPVINILSPAGSGTDQIISGNYDINWEANDTEDDDSTLDISIEYSPDGGSTWVEIMSGTDNNAPPYLWDTGILADGVNYILRINATDSYPQTTSKTSLQAFSIDNTIDDEWFFQMQPQGSGLALDMKPVESIPVSNPSGDLAAPGDYLMGRWETTRTFTGETIDGPWTFNVYGYSGGEFTGYLRADVLGSSTDPIPIDTTILDDENVSESSSSHMFTWTDTLSGTIPNGDSLIVDVWLVVSDAKAMSSGSSPNPDFDIDTTDWTGYDWEEGAMSYQEYPGSYITVRNTRPNTGGGTNTVSGYWETSFTPAEAPTTANLSFDVSCTDWDPAPLSGSVLVYLDTATGTPTNLVWSFDFAGTFGWASLGPLDVSGIVDSAAPYYIKVGFRCLLGKGDSATLGYDNVEVQWSTTGPEFFMEYDYDDTQSSVVPTLGGGPSTWDRDMTGFVPDDWVLMSFPIEASGHPEDVLNDTTYGDGQTDWDKIYAWDAVNQTWISYSKNRPDSKNTLTYLDNTMGFWLHLTSNGGDNLLTVGSGTYSAGLVTISLQTGWNLVSYPSITPEDAAATLPAEADFIAEYNNSLPYLIEDLSVVPGAVDMSEGNAYWVHATAICIWSILP